MTIWKDGVNQDLASLPSGTVDTADFAAGSVDANALAANSVDSSELVDGSVDSSHLSADAFDYVQDSVLSQYQAQGSNVKAFTAPPYVQNSAETLLDQMLVLSPLWLPEDETLTGVQFAQVTQGAYTADNENRIGLYTCDGTTFTLVASTPDDANLWKAPAGTIVSDPFSSTYAATRGLYYVGLLYSSSAESTAPQIATCGVLSGGSKNFGMPSNNFSSHRLTLQTSLPASFAASSTGDDYAVNILAVY